MRAQPAKAREWVCDHCGNTVPPNYAHKCLEFDRLGEQPTSGEIRYLWPSQNLRQIAERIESRAIEDAAKAGWGALGFSHSSPIRDIEAAFNVALHLYRIAAASVDRSPEGGDRETGRHAKHESAVPSEASADAATSAPSLQTPQGGDS